MVLLLILLSWSAGAVRKRRRLVHAVRDRAFFCLVLPGIWHSESVSGSSYLPSVLMILLFGPYHSWSLWLSGFLFLNTLHWPVE